MSLHCSTGLLLDSACDMWCCDVGAGNRAEEYQLPYYQYVMHDPSLDDMRKVVLCTNNIRPSIALWWSEDEVLPPLALTRNGRLIPTYLQSNMRHDILSTMKKHYIELSLHNLERSDCSTVVALSLAVLTGI